MKTHELHELAEKMARSLSISHGAACAILARRAKAKRQDQDRQELKQPTRRFWWQD